MDRITSVQPSISHCISLWISVFYRAPAEVYSPNRRHFHFLVQTSFPANSLSRGTSLFISFIHCSTVERIIFEKELIALIHLLTTMNRLGLRAASRHFQLVTGRPTPIARGLAARNTSVRGYATFNWEDPLAASELYTEEELAIQDTARQYCQERLMPRVLGIHPPPPPPNQKQAL